MLIVIILALDRYSIVIPCCLAKKDPWLLGLLTNDEACAFYMIASDI